jgi:Ala-tRNA(Pro) deacylase
MNVQSYLGEMGVNYHLSHHSTAYTAQDLAATEHIPGRQVVKSVVVRADGRYVVCALPASYRVDLNELREQLQASDVSLVEEEKLRELFPDCELGAEPPIGRIFGLPTMMDESLLSDEKVIFSAGTHTDAITMSLADYRRAAQPEIAHFGRHL